MNALHNELVRTIITTRDFCGNEKEAAADVFADHGVKFDDGAYKAAKFEANNQWRNFQKAAGVPANRVLW